MYAGHVFRFRDSRNKSGQSSKRDTKPSSVDEESNSGSHASTEYWDPVRDAHQTAQSWSQKRMICRRNLNTARWTPGERGIERHELHRQIQETFTQCHALVREIFGAKRKKTQDQTISGISSYKTREKRSSEHTAPISLWHRWWDGWREDSTDKRQRGSLAKKTVQQNRKGKDITGQ